MPTKGSVGLQRLLKTIIFFAITTFSVSTLANEIKHLVFFGDSLSYDGSLNPVISHTLRIPKSFTNGNSWNVALEKMLRNKKLDYKNYALPGGTAVFQTQNLITAPAYLDGQIINYLYHSTAQSRDEALIFIWVGFHDYVLKHHQITPMTYKAIVRETVAGIRNSLLALMAYGCKHFIVINLGDLSTTPMFLALNKKQITLDLIAEHNQRLTETVRQLNAKYKRDIRIYDVNAFFENIREHRPEFGIVHSTHACKTKHHICSNPEDFFYWDHLHFTQKVHQALAKSMYAFIEKSWPGTV